MKEVTLTELFTAIVNLTKAIEANTVEKTETAKEPVEPKEAQTPAEDDATETDGIALRDVEAALLEVEAALLEVEAAKDAATAQKLLKDITGSTSVKKADPAQYQAILDACEAALNDADEAALNDEDEPEPAEDDATETEGVALRDVEAALLEVKAAKGAAKAQKLLKDLTGSTSVKKADPAQYQAIIDACEAALNDADEPEPAAQHGDRNKMEELIAELATSELGAGKPENFETTKRLIKTVGKADKKANIADENIQPMIDALEKAIADLKADDDL